MSSLGLEATLTSSVTDGINLTIVTGVLETTLRFDAVSLELKKSLVNFCDKTVFERSLHFVLDIYLVADEKDISRE